MRTMTSKVTSITQAPSRLSAGIASIRQKAAVASAKPTQLEFCQSFGNKLSDIGGQCRWEIIGHALDLWLQDLSRRIDEVLHENQGVIFKRFSIRAVVVSRHCWMLGPSIDYAHPTTVICCSEPLLLKRIMRAILQHKFLGERGFDLKGIPACDVRLLMERMTPLQIPTTPFIGRSSLATSTDPDEDNCLICGVGLVVHDSGRSTTLGGVLKVDGATFGLTAGHVLNDALAPQVNTTNNQDIVLYDSDWALESPNGSEGVYSYDQELEENEPPECEERSVQYIHETVYTDIPGLKPRVQSLRVVAASVQDSSRSQQACDWVLIELPDALQNIANAISGYDRIVHDIEIGPPQGRVILLTRRGQINCIGAGSASSIKLLGSETFIHVWSLFSNSSLGNTSPKITTVYEDANDVQEPGDSGSWAIDCVSNKLLGVVVADCNTTGEAFIVPAEAIFTDIKLRLPASEVRLPRYRPNHSPIPTQIPTPAWHPSGRKLEVSQPTQKLKILSAVDDPIPLERSALKGDKEPSEDTIKELSSAWKSSRSSGSKLNTDRVSHQVRISTVCLPLQLTFAKISHYAIPPSVIPMDLSFLVNIDEIRPNEEYSNRSSDYSQGFFLPPNQGKGYDSRLSHCFRFHHAVFTPCPVNDQVHSHDMAVHNVATVFSQAMSTDHFSMVPLDARIRDKSDRRYDSSKLSFDHKRRNNFSSFASLEGSCIPEGLPAPAPPGWDQLIPKAYCYQDVDGNGKRIKPGTDFAGLIGKLPLLVALVAFSAVPDKLSEVLVNHIIGGKWIPHTYDTGREFLCLLYYRIYN